MSMKKNYIYILVGLSLVTLLSACLKKIEKFNSNTISVDFAKPGPNFLISDATVNPKDSIQFSYTVNSPTAMSYVTITKNDAEIVRDSVKTGDMKTFSAVKKLVADSAAGVYTYKVVARNSAGVYLGSSMPIVVTVTPDFNYYTNLRLYVPDSTAKKNVTYFNLSSHTAFSYSDVVSKGSSNQIDIGYYYDTDSIVVSNKKQAKGHTIYNMQVSPVPNNLAIYDISTFTKNLTLMKIGTSPTWANITSAGILRATGKSLLKGTLPNSIGSLTAGNVIFFKTAAGKYGALLVTYFSQATAGPGTYMNFEVKIEK
jgi:hypothetical protein